ncbi:ATP-binding protein [Peloplasma aerotolerans]|uniref:ATP-binding protein n=1 Tax=Peloplasma aerotolerans TaxID=3044389 RepID=A0AAW6U5Q5_9MOLU|nr:ATP-binding protein [Mariniplasma sp. M4Ah]MDI6453242.1 ATP-binding protein [Mariniplasma sp. M4Ah]
MIEGTAISKILYGILQLTFSVLVIYFLPKRFSKNFTIVSIFIALTIFLLAQVYFETLSDSLWIITIISMYALMFLFIYSTARVSWVQAIYLATQAFIYSQFVAAIEWQIYYYIGTAINYSGLLLIQYIIFIVFTSIFVLIFYVIYKHYHIKGYKPEIKRNNMVTVFAIMIIVFFMSNLSFLNIPSPISSVYPQEIFYIRTLVDLCGVVVILVLQEYQIIIQSQKEITILQTTFQKYYDQYLQSKENIQLANQRYHDIKHLINLIRAENNHEIKNKHLNDFEKELKGYYLQAETGNVVIDTIVTSMRMQCDELRIGLTYAIEGSKLSFMSTMELTSFIGNMFDNAIESSRKVENVENRVINISIHQQHALLIVNMENYYEHPLKYRDGRLITTKEDKLGHGYGIKSIQTIVSKYGGTLRIDTKDNWFILTILFPISDFNYDKK